MPPFPLPADGRRTFRNRRALRIVLSALTALLILGSAAATEASAQDTYKGLLHAGTLTITSNHASESGGYVYGADSWTAPTGTQFAGFAYTSATFSSVSDDSVGGVSAGFGGDGTANSPLILFPWTDDCSITHSGHYWTDSGGSTLAGTSGTQTCNTTGDDTGWNDATSELDNADPSTNPDSGYQTLWFTVFCQAATCDYDSSREWGAGGATVTNLSAELIDSNSKPTGNATWASAIASGSWYQTNSAGVALDLSASDPAGVCGMYGYLTGPATVTGNVVGSRNPSVTNLGGAIGEEFSSGADPCDAGQADTGTWTLPGGLTSGTYEVNLAAANPGNYEAQGFSTTGSPTVASDTGTIQVDDTVPTVAWEPGEPTGWTSDTSEKLDVTVGPSGLASVNCTDNGTDIAATLVSGSESGPGTTVWSVPTTVQGSNDVACIASNGDANGALTGGAEQTFEVDSTVPVITFSDPGYTEGGWSNQSQNVSVSASGGPSGIQSLACSLNGAASQFLGQEGGAIAVGSNGVNSLSCSASSNAGLTGSGTYTVNIDTEQPTLALLVNGGPIGSGWLSGTPVVTVIGSEDGGILSGLQSIACSVNGGPSFDLEGISAASDYTGSFELDQNGDDQISCSGTTVAGTTQTTPTTATINVDNPDLSNKRSELIDNGNDPYSDGPSQSKWYVTPQSVTITANNTGGPAPIAEISCKGALTGTWPISDLNTDEQNGEQITITVPAPGGNLSCTATDAAGNVYALGSYLFQIDDTPPTGYFVPQGQWPAPNEIELHVTDNGGSGVAVVRVYGQSPDVEQGQPQLVGDAQYDASTGEYVVTLPDGVAPWVAANWKFYANVADVAGNQGQITADLAGDSEDLTLPLREATSVTATAQQVVATQDLTVPGALAAAASLTGASRSASIAPRVIGTPASVSTPGTASAARAKHGGRILSLRYGQAVTISGRLRDVAHHGTPISGARILVYQELAGARRYTRLGSARTNRMGAYRYRVKPGASRTLYVVYPGSHYLRPAADQLQQHSRGSMTLAASSVHAGGSLTVTGVVRGGHIPPGGLVVTIRYRQLGAPGSGTLGTVRTNRHGRYRFTQHFSRRTRGLAYALWAVVSGGQSGWPYTGAATKPVIRHVG